MCPTHLWRRRSYAVQQYLLYTCYLGMLGVGATSLGRWCYCGSTGGRARAPAVGNGVVDKPSTYGSTYKLPELSASAQIMALDIVNPLYIIYIQVHIYYRLHILSRNWKTSTVSTTDGWLEFNFSSFVIPVIKTSMITGPKLRGSSHNKHINSMFEISWKFQHDNTKPSTYTTRYKRLALKSLTQCTGCCCTLRSWPWWRSLGR